MLRLKKISSCILCGAVISILTPTTINVFATESSPQISKEQKFGYLNDGMTYEEAKASDDNEAKNLVTKTKEFAKQYNLFSKQLNQEGEFSVEEIVYETLNQPGFTTRGRNQSDILRSFNKTLQRMKLKKLEEQLKEKDSTLADMQKQLKEKETKLANVQAELEATKDIVRIKEEEDGIKSHVLNLLLMAHSIGVSNSELPPDTFSNDQHSGTIVSTAHGWGLKTQGINHENWQKACVCIEKAIYEILKNEDKAHIKSLIQEAYNLLNDQTAIGKYDKLKANVDLLKAALESLRQ